MKTEIVTNLKEYQEVIQKLNSTEENFWFRGVSKSSYPLTPSLFREKELIGLKHSGIREDGTFYRKSDAVMKSDLAAIDKFIEYYKKYYPQKCQNFNLIDYLYVMQHYDIPTRLLDFSLDHHIALYFAVSKEIKTSKKTEEEINDFNKEKSYSKEGGAVYCIDPIYTNTKTQGKKLIFDIANIDIDELSKIDLPICIKGNNSNDRMVAQKGAFLLYGMVYKNYEQYKILEKNLVKIFIPNSCKHKIKKELFDKIGIDHTYVYPDLKGIALQIIDEIESKYRADCNSILN